jgi:hypothetical protein
MQRVLSLINLLIFTTFAISKLILSGNYVKLDNNSSEFVYQQSLLQNNPTAVVVLFHGCQHSSTDWWPQSASCVNCIGLPIETTIVQAALDANFFVIAISSKNRKNHRCWNAMDINPVSKIINHAYINYLNSNYSIPLHLLGASSGGMFIGMLSLKHKINRNVSSICVQISGVHQFQTFFIVI